MEQSDLEYEGRAFTLEQRHVPNLLAYSLYLSLQMVLSCIDSGYPPDAKAMQLAREALDKYYRWLKRLPDSADEAKL